MFLFFRRYRNSVFTFLLFITYAGAVFWSNYDSLQRLQANALVQLQLETEKQASAISYYFSERRSDIGELAESEVIVNFFKNSDMGMSYQYGLGVNVQLIEDRFENVAQRKRVGDQAAYAGFALIDSEGAPVAGWNVPGDAEQFKDWLAPANHEIRTRLGTHTGVLLLSAPVWVNRTYRGELLAWVNADTSFAQFGRERVGGGSLLVDRQTGAPLNPLGELSHLPAQYWHVVGAPMQGGEGARVTLQESGEETLALVKVDIAQTPLSFVSITSGHPTDSGTARLFVIAAGVIPLIVVLVAFLDVLERRRLDRLSELARREAERLAQTRTEFLANMSHEIRTPMNAIIGMAELCLTTNLNQKQRNYLSKIQRASDSLLRIINDILDFSKIESGKLTIEQLPFDLDQAIDNLGALLSEKANAKGIELVFDVDDSVKHTYIGDLLRLEQVLINLIGNAIKFSEQGNIVVRIRNTMLNATSSRLYFDVIDEGIGLSGEEQARLFNAFTQADTTTTRRYGGTGLGLAICKHLVELMGGTIRVDSVPGQGSCFRFFICLGIDPSQPARASTMAQQLAAHAHRPVLVVDANPAHRSALSAQLHQLGLAVEAPASSGVALEAVARPEAPEYLAVLIDLGTRGGDGLETIRQLRQRWARPPIPPIILLTTSLHDQEMGPDSGLFDSFLTKPTSASRLFAEIAPFLGMKSVPGLKEDVRSGGELSWLKGIEVLLVDDVPLNQEVIRDMLEDAGIRVRLANNGREALDAIARRVPDCVMMDCQMPVMDGYEATRQLRSDARFSGVPIIALTANAMPTEQARCRQAGMDGYLAKPVKSRDLLTALSAHVRPPAVAQPEAAPEKVAERDSAPTLPDRDFAPALPPLPGIDTELGVRYANGKPEIYRKLLRIFLESHGSDFATGFRNAYATGNWKEATRRVHSLKSAARTIGASRLGDLAETMEEACMAEQPEAVDPLLADLSRELEAICAVLSAATADSLPA